jgi:hypothetical protein
MQEYKQALKSTCETIKWYAAIDPRLARSIAENMQRQARFQRDNQIGLAPQVDAMYDASARALKLVVPPSPSMRAAHQKRYS